MSYRNKTCVAFDGDTDIAYYRLMKAWKKNEHIDFNFFDAHDLNSARDSSTEESIKAQLRLRMAESKQMVLLVGEKAAPPPQVRPLGNRACQEERYPRHRRESEWTSRIR